MITNSQIVGACMSKDGFNADDIASTFARFASKRRNIICDESILERKKPEPVELSSATHECGLAAFSATTTIFKRKLKKSASDLGYGLKEGSQGYGFYYGGNRVDTDK